MGYISTIEQNANGINIMPKSIAPFMTEGKRNIVKIGKIIEIITTGITKLKTYFFCEIPRQ